MPGVTAWYGLVRICEAKAGRTISVSAASGAIGMWSGNWRRRAGAAPSASPAGVKCDYVINELSFDACIDYKQHPDSKSLYAALKGATPDGIRFRKRRWRGSRCRAGPHE